MSNKCTLCEQDVGLSAFENTFIFFSNPLYNEIIEEDGAIAYDDTVEEHPTLFFQGMYECGSSVFSNLLCEENVTSSRRGYCIKI